jgi:6-phosphogluconolactonase
LGSQDTDAANDRNRTRWITVADSRSLSLEACRRIVAAADRAIRRAGRFLIVVAGGNTPLPTYRMLCAEQADWARWQVYFGDERCLPKDDPGRNSRSVADAWLRHVPIPAENVHAIAAELGATEAALAYADLLRDVGDFDLVLLGLGEDGHTASLFPGHDLGTSADSAAALAIYDAPKPPQQRVSLSAARLSRASEVLFLVEGTAKKDAVTKWRAGDGIPARAIQSRTGVDVLVESNLVADRSGRR